MQFIKLVAFGLTVANLLVLGLVKADSSGNDEGTSALGAQVAHLNLPAVAQGIKTVVYTVAYGPAPALYRTNKHEINGVADDKYENTAHEYLKREVKTVTETVTVVPDYCTSLLPVGPTTRLVNGSFSTAQTVMNTANPVSTQVVAASSKPVPANVVSAASNMTSNKSAPTMTIIGSTSTIIVIPMPSYTAEPNPPTTEAKPTSSILSTASSSSVATTSAKATTVPKATPTIASGASGSAVGSLAILSVMVLVFCTIFTM